MQGLEMAADRVSLIDLVRGARSVVAPKRASKPAGRRVHIADLVNGARSVKPAEEPTKKIGLLTVKAKTRGKASGAYRCVCECGTTLNLTLKEVRRRERLMTGCGKLCASERAPVSQAVKDMRAKYATRVLTKRVSDLLSKEGDGFEAAWGGTAGDNYEASATEEEGIANAVTYLLTMAQGGDERNWHLRKHNRNMPHSISNTYLARYRLENHTVTYGGVKMKLAEVSTLYGIAQDRVKALMCRYGNGQELIDALIEESINESRN